MSKFHHLYASVPLHAEHEPKRPSTFRHVQRHRLERRRDTAVAVVVLGVLLFALTSTLLILITGRDRLGEQWGTSKNWDFWSTQGPYAPFRVLADYEKAGLPDGCQITQVNILHRHGARYPTMGAGIEILLALLKVKEGGLAQSGNITSPELRFLKEYDFEKTGWEWDELSETGRVESYKDGQDLARRYTHTSSVHDAPAFVRSSGGTRVVETSRHWMKGYSGGGELPMPDVIISEHKGMNNTLNVKTCKADNESNPGEIQSETYLQTLSTLLLPILTDLLKPSSPFIPEDVVSLLSLCGYDRAAGTSTMTEERDGWCGVLKSLGGEKEREAWEGYGYFYDVDKYYRKGSGNPWGPSEGVGYVNELIARLTDSSAVDSTSTNHTLDDDEMTFPRGGRRVFVDFTHDNNMIHVAAGLGLYDNTHLDISHLPTDYSAQAFRMSSLVPFGARWTFERVGCHRVRGKGEETFVRVLINDQVTPIDHPACQSSRHAEHGLCHIDDFLESQAFARRGGDWDTCFV